LSDVSKVGDKNVEMEMQNNEVSNQANISSVEMTLKRKDKSLSNCPRPTELFSKVEKQYASYISKFPDSKIPLLHVAITEIRFVLQKLAMPHLEHF